MRLPVYFNEGPMPARKFQSTVYTSENTFSNKRTAEQDVAKHALECISKKLKNEGCSLVHVKHMKDPRGKLKTPLEKKQEDPLMLKVNQRGRVEENASRILHFFSSLKLDCPNSRVIGSTYVSARLDRDKPPG
ncbi:hypothetical protein F3Y22_tig00110388pilonHSYRG00018 [Hibiscus syriacus]|uniref:DRBM domain-containing protein n=1 Tax=Hibiscus syriacus TaxID=106335 RepID=A0A6A3APV4_HIBSY|nr:hypothetical protein F3Y22_tig00110388pilonHSYRG00018 [Hibiscus syriacus]